MKLDLIPFSQCFHLLLARFESKSDSYFMSFSLGFLTPGTLSSSLIQLWNEYIPRKQRMSDILLGNFISSLITMISQINIQQTHLYVRHYLPGPGCNPILSRCMESNFSHFNPKTRPTSTFPWCHGVQIAIYICTVQIPRLTMPPKLRELRPSRGFKQVSL